MNGHARHVEEEEEDEDEDVFLHLFEIVRWASNLAIANVINWGGMISTPAPELQRAIQRVFADTDCPPLLCDTLLEYSHERYWPSGLKNLRDRQNLRDQYDKYVCRRVPGMQAVVILHYENEHMPETLIQKPGICIAFAYGVE